MEAAVKIIKRKKSSNFFVVIHDARFDTKDRRKAYSTGESEKAKAYVAGLRIEREVKAGLDRGVEPEKTRRSPITSEFMCQLDLERLVGARPAKGHVEGITWAWKAIGSFFDDFYEVTAERLRNYVAFRRGRNPRAPLVRNQSIKRELQALKRTLTYMAVSLGYPVKVPVDWPKLKDDPKDSKRAGRPVSPEEVKKLFAAIEGNRRLFPIALFILATGLRREEAMKAEAVMMREPNEPLPAGVVAILAMPGEICKWGRARDVALTATARDALLAMGRRPYALDKPLRIASAGAGLQTISARTLRHALYKGGAMCGDAFAVKVVMGHQETDTSCHYVHGSDLAAAKVALAQDRHFGVAEIWRAYRGAPTVGGTPGGTVTDLTFGRSA